MVLENDLIAAVDLVRLPEGAVLCRNGDAADALFIVLDGLLQRTSERDPGASSAGPGDVAGGFPAPGALREATLTARTGVTVARIAHAAALALHQLPADEAARTVSAVFHVLRRRRLLARSESVFGPLDQQDLVALEGQAEWLSISRGHVLIREGDASDDLYVLLTGRLNVVKARADGTVSAVAEIAPGESIGEMAFFTGQPRSATVYALRDSLLVKFSNAAFEQIIRTHPHVLRQVTRVQIERLQRANQRLTAPPRVTNIAVVGVNASVSLSEFCTRLSTALSSLGPTFHLTADEVDRRLDQPSLADAPEGGPDARHLLAWLSEQEAGARFVVYETDPCRPAWSRRSIGQSDCVVLVADAREPPDVTALEQPLVLADPPMPGSRRILALLHPDGSSLPSGTRRWLDALGVSEHYHVRRDTPADVARLARFLAGTAVGLALGGGGARGFSHIGVMHALADSGIPVDIIGGTSMGAAMAAQFAMGWSAERMVQINRRVWIELRPHREYTLPLLSIVGNHGSTRCGMMMYGDTQIEDLWIPFFCVSSNLTTASMMVHRRGSLLWAVTASSSLPGFAVPVLENRQLLVDGALFNNLPGDVVRELGGGHLMVSRVSVDDDQALSYDRVPAPGDVLRGRMLRRPLKYPRLMEVVLRSVMLASINREQAIARGAEFCFQPPVEAFGLMQFDALEAIVDTGYRYAMERIARWRDAGALNRLLGATAS